MVYVIDFFDILTWGEGSKWSILLNFFDFSTFRPDYPQILSKVSLIKFLLVVVSKAVNISSTLFDQGGGFKWSMLLIFSTF